MPDTTEHRKVDVVSPRMQGGCVTIELTNTPSPANYLTHQRKTHAATTTPGIGGVGVLNARGAISYTAMDVLIRALRDANGPHVEEGEAAAIWSILLNCGNTYRSLADRHASTMSVLPMAEMEGSKWMTREEYAATLAGVKRGTGELFYQHALHYAHIKGLDIEAIDPESSGPIPLCRPAAEVAAHYAGVEERAEG